MLWNTFDQNREKLDAQYTNPEFNTEEGLDYEELKKRAIELANSESELDITLSRAHVIKFILENVRVGITPCEWFADKIDQRDILINLRLTEIGNMRKKIKDKLVLYKRECERKAWTSWTDFGHTAPGWSDILSLGLVGLRQRAIDYMNEKEADGKLDDKSRAFYESIVCVYDGALTYVKRLAAEARRRAPEDEKQYIAAENLENLCRRPPETLMEAMQLIFIYYTLQGFVENTNVRTLGTLDVLLYPYWEADIKSGRYTKEQLRELVRYFLFKAGAMKVTANIPFALCGVDEEGKGYVNELSYVIVEEYEKLNIYDPKIHIRWTKELPDDFIRIVLRSIAHGKNSFVFINSPIVADALTGLGYDRKEATNYTIVGCYETCAEGVEVPCSCNGRINIPKAVEFALNSGYDQETGEKLGADTPAVESIDTFEKFMDAVKANLRMFIDHSIDLVSSYEEHYHEIHTAPFFSSTYKSSLENGRDIYEGGAKYNNSSFNAFGIATAADALIAIKTLVFERGELTLSELAEILKKNWEGNELLRLKIQKTMPKYGNNVREVDDIAAELLEFCSDNINGRPNGRGGVCRMGAFSIDWRFEFGEHTGASADGRFAKTSISKNVCADTARDIEGATAHILSAVKLNYRKMPNGTVLDIVMHESAVSGEDGMNAFHATLNTFMSNGGFAIQYNILSPEILRRAQEHPEDYSTLQVRLCGWNVLFVNLSKKEQDEFIAQSEAVS